MIKATLPSRTNENTCHRATLKQRSRPAQTGNWTKVDFEGWELLSAASSYQGLGQSGWKARAMRRLKCDEDPSILHSAGAVLAAGVDGVGALSAGMAAVVAVSHSQHCGRRTLETGQRDHLSSRTAYPQPLSGEVFPRRPPRLVQLQTART